MSAMPHSLLDAVGGRHHVFVLPHPNHGPPGLSQQPVGVAVTRLVPRHLPPPPLRVAGRADAVLGAAVPEAAVDEHCDTFARKRHVHAASGCSRDGHLKAVAQTPAVQLAPQRHLGCGVPAGEGRHAGAQGLVGTTTRRLTPAHTLDDLACVHDTIVSQVSGVVSQGSLTVVPAASQQQNPEPAPP
jgi:hypothetical protein